MWDKSNFLEEETFVGNGFLGVKGLWGEQKTQCLICNIYSPQEISGKRQLLADLLQMRNNERSVAWCLVGDFNSVRFVEERKGVSSQQFTREMKDFDNFIGNMGLNDLPFIGKKFTWHRSNGNW